MHHAVRGTWPAVLSLVLALVAHTAAATPPSLTATAYQERVPAPWSPSPVQLWDTTWWVTLHATAGTAPLTRAEYAARFRDTGDLHHVAGGWQLEPADRQGFAGRVRVTCPSRSDYVRRFRLRVRVHDATGAASGWAAVDFPAPERTQVPAPSAPPVTTDTRPQRRHQVLGAVEVETSDDTTIAAVKAELQRKARAAGADAAIGFRLVRSTGNQATFAADAIRYVDDPVPTPTRVPESTDRVLAQIVIPFKRH